jgi:dCTP deaminase
MSFLSDRDILAEMDSKNIICTPFERENLSNSSIDLRLDDVVQVYYPSALSDNQRWFFDLDESGKVTTNDWGVAGEQFDTRGGFTLNPGDFVLASTLEYVGAAAPHILGQISDKSTMARLGLSTFFGAGYIDPGNVLNITLEIKNNGHVPIKLQYGMHICQIRFAYLSSPVMAPYNGKYLNSKTVECAK